VTPDIPRTEPSAYLYLVARTERLRLATQELQREILALQSRLLEINNTAILVLSGLDDLNDEQAAAEQNLKRAS
jgi:hypothetical protein